MRHVLTAVSLAALSMTAAASLLFISAQPAFADHLRLANGKVIEVESVDVQEDRFRVRMEKDGEFTSVDMPFDRFQPKYVLKVVDKYLDGGNAAHRLLSAHIALKVGLPEQAKKRFLQTAKLDPDLAPDVEAGLVKVEKTEAGKELKRLEDALRKSKKPAVELAGLEALLSGPFAGVLTATQRLQIKLLIHLAKQMIEREEERQKAKGGPGKKPDDDADDGTTAPPTEGNVPGGRTYADERWRSRRGPRRGPPAVPGAERPPIGGGATGGGKPGGTGGGLGGGLGGGTGGGRGGGAAGGGSSGGGRGGGSSGGSSGGSAGGGLGAGGSSGGLGR